LPGLASCHNADLRLLIGGDVSGGHRVAGATPRLREGAGQ
jgi:hypothetical protein